MEYDKEYEVVIDTKQPDRLFALVTYAIALVCLLCGLLLPLNGTGFTAAAMLGLQLPAAFNNIVPLDALSAIADKFPFAYADPVHIGSFELFANDLFLLLYALATVCAIVALIPAIVSTVAKKNEKNIPLNVASFIEGFALTALTLLVLGILDSADTIADFNCYALMIAFGGTFLMLVLQAFYYKKGSGAIKFVLALISLLTVVFTLNDVAKILPFTENGLKALQSDWLGIGFVDDVNAHNFIALFLLSEKPFTPDIALNTLNVFVIMATYLAILNCILDIWGLGKKTNKIMPVANLIRYAIEAVLAIVVIVIPFFITDLKVGLFAILLGISALISLLINLLRLLSFKKKAAEAQQEDLFDGEEDLFATEQKPVAAVEKAEPKRPEPVQTESSKTSFYAPMIYYGPTDDFIRSLNNDLKIEFSRVFLERKSNPLTFIPDYVVGGKNDRFFNAVFIYYGRICELVSDGLMNAIYKQANIMR
ncbi:MAG: hypothetical protein K2K80_06655 [Clostridia bacterium]|nr:hypothetical protein [Clostridia bacterium]